jgi:hypothetical protein
MVGGKDSRHITFLGAKMPSRAIQQSISFIALLVAVCCLTCVSWAQTSAFTYQGRLTDVGNPANGNFDLQFKLFDMMTVGTGAQVGATLVRNPVAASAGVFTVTLDFGANVFGGANRFLEIGVRPAGSANPYTLLAPRQPLTSSPYAIQTLNAQQLGGLPASDYVTTANGGSSFIKNGTTLQTGNFNINGNGFFGGTVGIGTTTPEATLHVNGVAVLRPDGVREVSIGSPGGETGIGIKGTSNRADLRFDGTTLKLVAGLGTGPPAETNGITITTAGNVGIGFTDPFVKLRIDAGSSIGVLSTSNSSSGVVGGSNSGTGVSGTTAAASLNHAGVFGRGVSSGSIGVTGEAGLDTGTGVYGVSESPTGYGMVGRNNSGGYAGYFDGKVRVLGVIEKPGGGFKIDHPLDPENKYLIHSFVESPDMKNLYDGTVTTDAQGEAEVTLPDWFAALNRDFRYQLTCLGVFAQAIIAEKIKDNRFKIKTSLPNVEVSWQITGTRQDAWAQQHRLPVEEPKPAVERGSYQNPSAFGQPEEKSIEWARRPEQMRQLKEQREKAQQEKREKP